MSGRRFRMEPPLSVQNAGWTVGDESFLTGFQKDIS